jgi:hypothetical protein
LLVGRIKKADGGDELAVVGKNALLLAKSSSPKGMSTKPRESSNFTSSSSYSRIWKEEQEEWSCNVSDMKPTEIIYKK